MKKVLSLALALIMVLSLSVTAFAADSDKMSITINHKHEGHTYEAYQIFTGNFNTEGVLSNIVWGKGVKNTDALTAAVAHELAPTTAEDVKTAADVAALLSKDTASHDTAEAKAFASILATKNEAGQLIYLGVTEDAPEYDEELGHYVFDDLVPGYYLVKDAEGTRGEESEAYTYYILKVTHGNTIVNPKAGVPTLTKKVDDENDSDPDNGNQKLIDSADHDIGDMVPFTLTATMPSGGMEYYETYKVIFHDKMSPAFMLDPTTVKVMFGDTDVTKYFTTSAVVDGEFTVSCDNVKQIVGLGNQSKLVLTYKAQLTANGVVYGVPGNPNEAWLEYSNNPNYSGEGEENPTSTTPPDKVVVFTYFLNVNKTSGGASVPLAGADFKLEKLNKTSKAYELVTFPNNAGKNYTYTYAPETTPASDLKYNVTMSSTGAILSVVDSNGIKLTPEQIAELNLKTGDAGLELATGFYFYGLDAGHYRVTETKTPSGYNTLPDSIYFVVTATHSESADEPELTELKVDHPDFSGDVTDGKIDTEIMNTKGSILPSTGGMGTTLFYILGSVMVVGATVLLVTKKRVAR